MPTTAQTDAADQAAQADIDNGGTDFYAEIGTGSTGNTPDWSISAGGGTIISSTQAPLASVTKSLSAATAAELGSLTSTDWPYLTMTAGRDAMQGSHCVPTDTIHSCAITTHVGGPLNGVQYDAYDSAHDGIFSYDSGSWQYYFDSVLGLGIDSNSLLKALYQSNLNLLSTDISCTTPMPAGGAQGMPTTLRKIVQQILNNTLNITGYLQDSNTPVNASEWFTDGSVFTSPAPDAPWKYKWGFWIEPDTNDFWMAGSFGTVVWIKNDLSMYGIVFRNDNVNSDGPLSMATMQNIRRAYLTGVGPYDVFADSSVGPVSAPSSVVATVTTVLTSGTTWAVPNDCTSAMIECIGGGASGWNAANHNGGAGGDYAKKNNVSLTPNSTVNIQVGAGGASTAGASTNAGTDTWFKDNSGTTVVLARGGASSTSASVGDVKNAGGGNSGTAQLAGGGGAGGPNAAGNPSANPPGATTGGQGDGTSGGAGGTTNNLGSPGAEWTVGGVTAGSGGGGGASPGSNGRAGGNYGGGGGGAATSGKSGGDGADGVIIITYQTPA